MAKEKAAAMDAMEAKVHGPNVEVVGVVGKLEGACWARDAQGNLSQVWHETGRNVVVNQGRGALFNKAMGFQTASSFGMYAIPYSATTGSNMSYADFSTAVLSNYGANVPKIAFGSTYVEGSCTGTISYGISAGGAQTISGVALAWYTTDTMSTGAAAANVCLYNMGSFAATQQLQSNNTLSVTITLSLATA